MSLDRIIREVHPTEQLEVTTGTVGESVTNYLAENGCRIQIIGQLSVNDSVQFFGVPDQGGGSRFLFICIFLDSVEAKGWGSGNYYNQEWGGRFEDSLQHDKCRLRCFRQPLSRLLVVESC